MAEYMNHCNFCVNTPKKASYIVGDKPICKNCLNSTFLQNLYQWKQKNVAVVAIQSKQVNRYNLPIDCKYKVLGFDYCGSILDGGGSTCQNCNRIIVNIATVENEAGKKYDVGLDCAETLSLVDSSDFWKIKEREAMHRKISKWVRDIKARQTQNKPVSVEKWENCHVIYFGSMMAYKIGDQTYNQYFKNIL